MIRVISLLLFSIYASDIYSQVYTYRALGYSIYNLMNDNQWTDYEPEKNVVYIYHDIDNKTVRVYDATTDKSSDYKWTEIVDPFINSKENRYALKSTQTFGDLVLHQLIQFVSDNGTPQIYITFGESITIRNLEFIEKRDSPNKNFQRKGTNKNTRKTLKKNPNFNLN